jgi:hypothetical protein
MCDRVVHRRSFEHDSNALQFDTAVDIFKVIHVYTYNGLPTVWYETLKNPIHRNKVTLHFIFDNEFIPDNSTHVGSAMFGSNMFHVYQELPVK